VEELVEDTKRKEEQVGSSQEGLNNMEIFACFSAKVYFLN
jgi:hypothetical protein